MTTADFPNKIDMEYTITDQPVADVAALQKRLSKLEHLYRTIKSSSLRHNFLIRTIMDELEKPA